MSIGYGRVSTRDQNPDAQRDALAAAGCDQVFIDKASGKLASRPELDKALLSANRAGHADEHPRATAPPGQFRKLDAVAVLTGPLLLAPRAAIDCRACRLVQGPVQ